MDFDGRDRQDPARNAAELTHEAAVARVPDARQTLAGVYDSLGHGAENGTWRNFYLNPAMELRHGENAIALDTANPEMAMALTTAS